MPEIFSKDAYRSLLAAAAREGYSWASFARPDEAPRPRIFLRHDVDYSLALAVELAEINRTQGVVGTFCILLRSHLYNPLSSRSLERIGRLRACGQELALHYVAPPRLPAGDGELAALVRADFETLRAQVPDLLPAFAWHNPTPELLERGRSLEVPGLVDLYAPRFVRDARYASDSNLRHSAAELEALLTRHEHDELQLLCHPVIWVAGGRTMLEVLANAWPRILRECEEEMETNRAYAEALPDGMPAEVVEGFARRWLEAASKGSA